MSYLVEQPPHCDLLRLSLSTGRFVLFGRTTSANSKSIGEASEGISGPLIAVGARPLAGRGIGCFFLWSFVSGLDFENFSKLLTYTHV